MHPRKDCLCCDARCPRLDPHHCQVDTRMKRAHHVCTVSFVLGERASALCLHGRLRVGAVFSPCRIRHERNRILTRGCGENRRTIRGPFLEDSDALRFSLCGGSLAQRRHASSETRPDSWEGKARTRGKSEFIRSGGPIPWSVAPPFDSLRIGGSHGEHTSFLVLSRISVPRRGRVLFSSRILRAGSPFFFRPPMPPFLRWKRGAYDPSDSTEGRRRSSCGCRS